MKLEIRLIEVEGQYKALVLDMGFTENRLKAIFEGYSLEDVSRQANEYIRSSEAVLWQ